MGGSSFSKDYYTARADTRAKDKVPDFAYDKDIKAGVKPAVAHTDLSPHGVTRESCDSPAHPESLAIMVVYDVTGSMGGVPVVVQKKLPELMGLLTRKGYVEHPQILSAAVGDFYADAVPLQVGQFESGVEIDDDLHKIYLEGGGGGTNQESYQLALYFAARHTKIDCFTKRNKKGYLFIIGDEAPYDSATKSEIQKVFGDNVQGVLTVEALVAEAQERYHTFFIIPAGTQNANAKWLKDRWTKLLGAENVLFLKDAANVSETIALAIGVAEGTIDIDGVKADLKDAGASAHVVADVSAALDPLAARTALTRVGTGNLPERADKASATNARL